MRGSPRWRGQCRDCHRADREVETRYEHAALTLCDGCAHARSDNSNRPASPTSAVKGPGPGQEMPLVRQLVALYEAGEISDDELGPWRLGPLPGHASRKAQLIAEQINLYIRLLLTEGVARALPYATSEPVKARIVRLKGSASYHLRWLEDERVICCIGEMPKLGKGNGTKLFVPPSWRPADPRAIELAGEDGLANLVWIPDKAQLVGTGVEPSAELADELIVVDGLHGVEPSSAEYPFSPARRRQESRR